MTTIRIRTGFISRLRRFPAARLLFVLLIPGILPMPPGGGGAGLRHSNADAAPAPAATARADSSRGDAATPDRLKALRRAVRGSTATDSLRVAAAAELGNSPAVEDRILALDLLDAARFSHRDDPEFLRLRARVLEVSNQPARAREALEELLEIRPRDVGARVDIARLRLQELIQHYDLGLAQPMLDVLRRALEDDPDHPQALFLAALALELQGSVDGQADTGRLAEGVTFAERLLAAHPDAAEPRFLLAVLRLDLGQVIEAGRQFERAMAGADDAWRAALESVEWTAPDAAVARLRTADDSLRERYAQAYWKHHDPTPLSLLNENRLEIAKRIILAAFLFGNPERGVRGWDTAPGEVFIRYGPPKAFAFEPGMVTVDPRKEGRSIRLIPSSMLWVYRFRNFGLRLKFEDVTCNYNYRPSIDTEMALATLRHRAPVVFHEAPSGEIRQLYLASGGTAGTLRRVRQTVHLGVPLWREPGSRDWLKEARIEIVVKDSTRTVLKRSQRRASADDLHLMFDDQGLLLVTAEFDLEPGHYTVAAFVDDLDRKVQGVLSVPMDVRNFHAEPGLVISDVEVTLEPGEEGTAPAASRLGVRSIPNPLGVVGDARRLNLFYEIYGLAARAGRVRHEVRYTVVPRDYALEYERHLLRDGAPDREDLVTRVAAGKSLGAFDLSETNSLDVVFPEQVSDAAPGRVVRATRVGIPRLDPGEYALIVTVHDIVADTSRAARAAFRVMPDEKIRELLVAARTSVTAQN